MTRTTTVPTCFVIEGHLAHLVAAAGLRCPDDHLRALWTDLERKLSEHFALQERTLLADLLEVRPREARVVLQEHHYLRGRLAQLHATWSTLSPCAAPALLAFLNELAAHGRHEERLVHWGGGATNLHGTTGRSLGRLRGGASGPPPE